MKIKYNIAFFTAMKKSGLNQSELAKRTKINKAYISRFLNGFYNPTSNEKRRLAKALRTSQKKLFKPISHEKKN